MKQSLKDIDNKRYTPIKKKKQSYTEFSAKKNGMKNESPFSQATDNYYMNQNVASSYVDQPSDLNSSNINALAQNMFSQNTSSIPVRNNINCINTNSYN